MKYIRQDYYFLIVRRIALVMLLFTIARICFFIANSDLFPNVTFGHFVYLMAGGLRFDLTAILYTNLLYILVALLPFRFVHAKAVRIGLKILFLLTNAIIIAVNIADIGYFRFTMHRTTLAFLSEFGSNNNMLEIILSSFADYWYLFLLWIVMGIVLWVCYGKAAMPVFYASRSKRYGRRVLILIVGLALCALGIRSKIGLRVQPLSTIDAGAYVAESMEAAIVLNTPFCIFFSSQQVSIEKVHFFEDRGELEKIYTPVHNPVPHQEFIPCNVVIIILEGFTRAYFGALNTDIPGHVGHTPFLDSLIARSHTYTHAYANGIGSLDAPSSILGSIPQLKARYSISPYSSNKIKAFGSILQEKGYHTSFFHGADNGSMGFLSLTKLLGFRHYYGRTEYNNDRDYDGVWGIWDEPFLQYYAEKLATFPQPFLSAVFTLTSHAPHHLPEEYEKAYQEETSDEYRCVRYTDHALQRFFETASKMPWFENTIFVVTSDHSQRTNVYQEYSNPMNHFAIPIIYYFPCREQGIMDSTITSQIDIFPTILDYMHYDRPYFAFGRSILNNPRPFVVNYSSDYHLLYDGYLLVFDGEKSTAFYPWNHRGFGGYTDNLLNRLPEQQEQSETLLKAIIQQFNTRVIENKMIVEAPAD